MCLNKVPKSSDKMSSLERSVPVRGNFVEGLSSPEAPHSAEPGFSLKNPVSDALAKTPPAQALGFSPKRGEIKADGRGHFVRDVERPIFRRKWVDRRVRSLWRRTTRTKCPRSSAQPKPKTWPYVISGRVYFSFACPKRNVSGRRSTTGRGVKGASSPLRFNEFLMTSTPPTPTPPPQSKTAW